MDNQNIQQEDLKQYKQKYDDLIAILSFFSNSNNWDIQQDLFWRCDEKYAPITFWIRCDDLFYWACGDLEEIKVEMLPELQKCIDDCINIDPDMGMLEAGNLFACRRRKMRPQKPAYPKNKALWTLFDSCGPERKPQEEDWFYAEK
jgi:hypothetical protein